MAALHTPPTVAATTDVDTKRECAPPAAPGYPSGIGFGFTPGLRCRLAFGRSRRLFECMTQPFDLLVQALVFALQAGYLFGAASLRRVPAYLFVAGREGQSHAGFHRAKQIPINSERKSQR